MFGLPKVHVAPTRPARRRAAATAAAPEWDHTDDALILDLTYYCHNRNYLTRLLVFEGPPPIPILEMSPEEQTGGPTEDFDGKSAAPARRGHGDQQPRQLDAVAGVEPAERRQTPRACGSRWRPNSNARPSATPRPSRHEPAAAAAATPRTPRRHPTSPITCHGRDRPDT
jgi:hypothetical protein